MSSLILPRLTRRGLLATGTAAAGVLALPAILRAGTAPVFSHGVQSGERVVVGAVRAGGQAVAVHRVGDQRHGAVHRIVHGQVGDEVHREVGQAEVEDHGVGRPQGDGAQTFLPGVGALRLVACCVQGRRQEAVNLRLVVDDEDLRAKRGHAEG